MTIGRRLSRPIRLLFVAFVTLGIHNPLIHAFQGRQVVPRASALVPRRIQRHDRRPSQRLLLSVQGQLVEDDVFLLNMHDTPESSMTVTRWPSWFATPQLDRKQMAELGISFMLSYNLISNINGSMFLSLSWYISSVRVSDNFTAVFKT